MKKFRHSIFDIPHSIFRWATATRLRKILSSILAILILLTSIRFIFLRPKEVLASSLFSLNEGYGTSTNDTSGAVSAGTVSGAVWRTDELCFDEKCLFFDGTQDFVSFADDNDLDFTGGGSFTITAWIRHAPKTSGTDIIVGKILNSDNDGGWQIQMESDGDITCEIEDSDADTTIDDSATSTAATYDDARWHFIACVKDANTSLTLYIDGVQVAQDASINATATLGNDDTLYIGMDGDGTSNDYTGFIDEVSIIRYAKTLSELATDYLGSIPSTSGPGPVGYWKLDEAGDTTRLDSSGNGNDLTESASDTVAQATGKYDSAADFEQGDTEYLEIADASQTGLDLGNTFTMSAWLNAESVPLADNYDGIVTKAESAGWAYAWALQGSGGSPVFRFMLDNDGFAGGGIEIGSATGILTTGEWNHFAITYDGKVIRLYKNGVEQKSGDFPYSTTITPFNGTSAFRLGNWQSQGEYYDGLMDEVRVYNYVRTQTQILEDMTVDPPTGVSASFGPNRSYLSNGLVAYWPMDEYTGTSTADKSGNGNNSTTWTNADWDNGLFNYGIDFDGTDDNVRFAETTSTDVGGVTSPFTVSALFITAANYTTNATIMAKYNATTTAPLFLYLNSSEQACFTIGNTDGQTDACGTTALNDDTWHHIVGVKDTAAKTITLYVDGVRVASSGYTSTNTYANNDDVSLGNAGTSYTQFDWDGRIDEGRIYNRALSPAEVQGLLYWAAPPIAYWSFDENTGSGSGAIKDRSGGENNGTTNGTTNWAPGKFGSGLNLDGSTGYVSVADPGTNSALDIDNRNMTITAWIKLNAVVPTDSCYTILSKGSTDGTDDANYLFALCDNTGPDILLLQAYSGGYQSRQSNDLTSLQTNTWYHIAIIHFNGGTFFYLNGALVGTDGSLVTNVNDKPLWIGGSNRAGGGSVDLAFNGVIDEVKIYKYYRFGALHITEDMNGGHPAPGSPVGSATARWKFDEGASTTAYDSNTGTGGAENLTLSTATSSWSNSGKFGKAFSAGGARWLTRTDDSNLDFTVIDDIAISVWVKSTIASAGNPSATEYIVNKPPSGAANGGYALYANTSGQICFGIDDDNTSFPEDSVCTSSDVYDNTWHHIVAVYTPFARLDMYLDKRANGTPDTSISALTNTFENTSTFFVGSQDAVDDTDDFNGDIDELQLFRLGLAQEQINMLYNQGAEANLGATSTDSSNVASWSAENEYCPPGQGSTCTAPVGEWKFDENTGTSAFDTSGTNSTGTLTSGAYWATGKFGTAAGFDNTNDYVNMGDIATLDVNDTEDFTISAWVNVTDYSVSSDDQTVVSKADGQGDLGYIMHINDQDGLVRLNVSDGTDDYIVESQTAIPTNEWHHIVFVWDQDSAANTEIYIDGIDDNATDTCSTACAISGVGTITNTTSFRIGEEGNTPPAEPYYGAIDNVRFYKYARTPAQIAWEYNRSKPVAWWKMDESSWNGTADEVKDSSGNGYLGVRAGNATTTTGKFNNGGTFDGTDDNVRIDESPAIDFGSTTDSYTISAWFKTTTNYSNNATIIAKNNGLLAFPFSLHLNSSEQPCFQIWDGTNSPSSCGVTALNDGNWHHAVGIRNVSTDLLYLFIDGRQIDTSTDSTSATTVNNADISIGNGDISYTATDFNGQIDDARIYTYVLTAQQVTTIYNEGAAARFAPLTGTP